MISACDVDGDGREEIYFLNTNTYSGASDTGELDKLFRFNDETGKFEDILTKDYNIGVLENLAGRSVVCIDRKGKIGEASCFSEQNSTLNSDTNCTGCLTLKCAIVNGSEG